MIKHILGFQAKCMFYACSVAKYAIQLPMEINGFEDNSAFYSCFIVKNAYAHKFYQHLSHQIEGVSAGPCGGLVKENLHFGRCRLKQKSAKCLTRPSVGDFWTPFKRDPPTTFFSLSDTLRLKPVAPRRAGAKIEKRVS